MPCLQCGICTASCALAKETQAFPRRILALVQLGGAEQALRLTAAWECHACGDCTVSCPNQRDPAATLAELRREAIGAAAGSGATTSLLGNWRGLGVALLAGIGGILLAAGVTGNLMPPGAVRYSKFLPHSAVVAIFSAVALGGLLVMVRSAWRAWRWFAGDRRLSGWAGLASAGGAIADAFSHRKHRACGRMGERLSALAHAATMFGFVGLSVTTAVTATVVAAGGLFPFELHHPVKLTANVMALLLIGGSLYALVRRLKALPRGTFPKAFDGFLPLAVLSLAASGVALEGLRLLELPTLAYPLYALHLAMGVLFLGLWPHTKMAHAFLRLVALTSLRLGRQPHRASRQAPSLQTGKDWYAAF